MPSILENILVERQGVGGTVDNIKNTLSSWDSCMAQSYCKWPVIAVIVVGSLIVLSLLFCCARCLCCGMECCCGICSCCNACCPKPRRRRDKGSYNDPPYQPVGFPPQGYQGQYQSHGPPTYASPSFNPAPSYNGGRPQYAQFDVNKPSNPDALPSMPSWEHAENRKVEVLEDPADHMEMNDLENHRYTPGTADDEAPIMQGFAGGAAGTGHTRPGMTESHSTYDTRSPYDRPSPYASQPTSPHDEREAFVAGGMQHPSQSRFSPTNDGYHHDASETRQNGPDYNNYENQGYEAAGSQFHPDQHFAHQAQQMPPQQSYRAFSPPAGADAAAPTYPGQRTYQDALGLQSPVSPVSPQGPGRAYPEQHHGQQELSDPNRPAQGWAARKAVGGSWRDV